MTPNYQLQLGMKCMRLKLSDVTKVKLMAFPLVRAVASQAKAYIVLTLRASITNANNVLLYRSHVGLSLSRSPLRRSLVRSIQTLAVSLNDALYST
jgi:hypothetical protein